MLAAIGDLEDLLPILLDQGEDLGWDGFVADIDLIFSLSFCQETFVTSSAAAALQPLALSKCVLFFLNQLSLLLAQVQEIASVGTQSNSFVPLSLFLSLLHDCLRRSVGIVDKTWILYLLSHTEVVNQSLLLLILLLHHLEVILHLLQLFCEKIVLLSDLLSGDSQKLVFFLGVDQVGSNSAQFFLSLVDLVHVAACLEPALLDQLCQKAIISQRELTSD